MAKRHRPIDEFAPAEIGVDEHLAVDPRIRAAEVLADGGDRAACDALLDVIWRERSTDPWTYHEVGDMLRRLGDTAAALKWANTGSFRFSRIGEEPSQDTLALLSLRYQLRMDMGFTEDDHDLLAIEWLWSDDDLDGDDEG